MRSEIVSDENTDEEPEDGGVQGQDPAPLADRVSVVLMATYSQPDAPMMVCNIRAGRIVRAEEQPLYKRYTVQPGVVVPLEYAWLQPEAVEVFMLCRTGFRNGTVMPSYRELKELAAAGVHAQVLGPTGATHTLLRPGRGTWLDSPGQLSLAALVRPAVVDVFLFPY